MYEISNKGTVGLNKGKTFTDTPSLRSIDEWITLGGLSGNNPDRRFAMGKYQIIPKTLSLILNDKNLGLTGDEYITNDLQEYIFKEYFMKQEVRGSINDSNYNKKFSIYKAITDEDDDENSVKNKINEAALYIAKIWASVKIPVTYTQKKRDKNGKVISKKNFTKGSGYYDGDGSNTAGTSEDNIIEALKTMRKDYHKLKESGKTEMQAYDALMQTDKAIEWPEDKADNSKK